jgi:competence protein ComEC
MQWTSAPNIGEAPLPQRARGYWKTRFSAFHEGLEKLLEAERAQLPPWFVVGFGSGIAAWFALDEHHQWIAFLCFAAALTLIGFGLGSGRTGRALGWFALAATLGCALVWARASWVAQPRLARSVVTKFDAEVTQVEPLAARETVRLTLTPRDPSLPPVVRVNVPQDDVPAGLARHSVIRVNARMMPPPPMALPGSHDFARDFWFMGIGASGRSFGAVQVLTPKQATGMDAVRARLDRHIRTELPGSPGTIATAFATGNQNAISEDDADAMRRSGLAHLLSVGGLHITAVVGITMLLTIRLLALSSWLALRANLVIVAAGAGALAAIGYTVLTGAQVPMVRSCIAALLILGGMMLGREAVSLRLLAVAALLILVYVPEAIVGPSFQMTFAAIGAIIALHSTAWARKSFQRRDEHIIGRILRAATAIMVTGLAVELSVMPFALYHFHRAGPYGVVANIIAIPLTEMVIMPLEALSLALDAIGLGRPVWAVTGFAISALLGLAHAIASSTRLAHIPDMPGWSFALLSAGLAWVGLWTTRIRLLGLLPIAVGALAAFSAPTPDLLVSGDGQHLAVVDGHGTPLLLRERAGDYTRRLFAEASAFDGDPGDLGERPYSDCTKDACVALISKGSAEWRLLATRSMMQIDWDTIVRSCSQADVAVSDRRLPRGCKPRWLKLDRSALARTGGLAIYLGEKPRVETVADRVGEHPWALTNASDRSTPRARFPTGR